MTTQPNNDLNPGWLSLLQGERHSRVRGGLVTGIAALGAYRQCRSWITDWQEKRDYTVSVADTDEVYYDLHAWVVRQLPSDERRSLRVYTRRVRSDDEPENEARRKRRVHLMYDGSRTQVVHHEGHRVLVSVEEPEVPKHSEEPSSRRLGRPGAMTLRCRTVAARDAMLRLVQSLSDEHELTDRAANQVWIAARWGSWESIGGTVPRPLESVVLAGNQREELVADLGFFLQQESTYTRLGIPWHRGYLLHGPPGTGKTSIAQALAGHFDMDVYYVPLSDLNSDTNLADLLARVEPRSMLLLEDVDVAHAARERDDDKEGVSLSGLLNALDGVITPHGLITVMTTNNLEVLDDALTRPGRADRLVSIGYATEEQIRRLIDTLLGITVNSIPTVTAAHRVTPAEIVEAIKPHLGDDDPSHAVRSVGRLLLDRTRTPHETDPVEESVS